MCWWLPCWILMEALCISLKFSLCAALFTLVLCPVNSSLLSLPLHSALSHHFHESARLPLDSPFLYCNLTSLSEQNTGTIIELTSPVSWLSGITVICCLMPRHHSWIPFFGNFSLFFFFFNCFSQESKSGSCYSTFPASARSSLI